MKTTYKGHSVEILMPLFPDIFDTTTPKSYEVNIDDSTYIVMARHNDEAIDYMEKIIDKKPSKGRWKKIN